MSRVVTITKAQALRMNNGKGLSGAKGSVAVKVGPNIMYNPTGSHYHHINNLAGLCYEEEISRKTRRRR